MVAVFPAGPFYVGNTEFKGAWRQATSYLVVNDSSGLKVLWMKVVPVFMFSDLEASPRSFEVVMEELVKRMKARPRNAKK